MSFKRIMSLIAMAFLWTGSQIPVYIFGAHFYNDSRSKTGEADLVEAVSHPISTLILGAPIGGSGLYVPTAIDLGLIAHICEVLANLLALAAICPFVGSLSDLMGRRWVAITGAAFIILGMIISSTANTMNIFICA